MPALLSDRLVPSPALIAPADLHHAPCAGKGIKAGRRNPTARSTIDLIKSDPGCSPLKHIVWIVLSLAFTHCVVLAETDQPSVGFCKPYTWLFGGWVAPPRLPHVADMNGDGFADFLYATPDAKLVDISVNGKGWKPTRGERLISDMPDRIAAMVTGRFTGTATDLAMLGAGGQVWIAEGAGDGKVKAPQLVATVGQLGGQSWLLRLPVRGWHDRLAVVRQSGLVTVLEPTGSASATFRINQRIVGAASGVLGDESVIAVHTGSAVAVFRPDGSFMRRLPAPRGQAALAMGDVDGDGSDDLLVSGSVFLSPHFRKSVQIPGWESFRKPVIAMLADVTGNGRCDVIVQHQGPDYYASKEADCNVYVSYRSNDVDKDCDGLSDAEEAALGSDPLDRDTDYDGLPDGWEVHGFRGFDLKAMGASPLRKDVFVLNQPYDTVPIDQMEKLMAEKVRPLFETLPNRNRDGSTGIRIHAVTQLPALDSKAAAGKGWPQLAAETFPKDRIGVFHWMLVPGLGGGGQSGQLADAGSGGMASWAHEFGHQLGLSHTGKWAKWSPTYTSLMNYSYSYQFEGNPEKIHFSRGELADIILNESRLPGKLPRPIEKLMFLSGPPYHFRVQSAGPNATYVDWGWSGTFTDRRIRANITYGYSVNGGERLQPSGTKPIGAPGPCELMTDYQATLTVHRGRLYMITADREPLDPKALRPESARLVIQRYLGKRAWTPKTDLGMHTTGDPMAISDGRTFYVFYPTKDGIRYRLGSPDRLGEPILIPDTAGCSIGAVTLRGAVLLFLHRGPNETIRYCTVRGNRVGPIKDLGIKSTITPGAAYDPRRNELLLGTAAELNKQPYRWQLRRLAGDPERGFTEVSCVFVGGEKSGWAGSKRPNLIYDPSREFGPDGRIYWIAAGVSDPPNTPTGLYIAQTIGVKDRNEGWMLWRYYDEWTNTRSGIAAAWYRGDIVLATTWASDQAATDGGVYCAHNGTAIGNEDMADFDDVTLMADYGIARSIQTFAEMPR